MIRPYIIGLVIFTFLASSAVSNDKTELATNRGAMLYENHCQECHTQQVHWRDKTLVSDSKGLFAEVTRWQHTLALDWKETDIGEVSRYLNDRFYHYK
jgi:ethanolamine utilization protein EutP (predicted NTPase)